MSRRGSTPGPKLSLLLLLGAGFAVVGVALIVWGVTTSSDPNNGGKPLAIAVIVVGAASLGLGGYLAWGFGWLKKRPELVAKAQKQHLSSNRDETLRNERRRP